MCWTFVRQAVLFSSCPKRKARTERKITVINTTLRNQLIGFGITLVLLAISLFAFKSFDWTDYILIGIGTIELIRIIATVVKLKKSAQS